MSVINVILNEKLYKPGFMKIFTDLPFLVRLDNQKLLRRSDVEHAKNAEEEEKFEEEFYAMNAKTGKPVLMPGTEGNEHKTLRLEEFGIDPELEGEWSVKTKDGDVKVTTVFEMLKKSSAEFTPE